jgi:hypothetical protein
VSLWATSSTEACRDENMGDSINFKKTIAVALLQVATLGSARSLWSAQPATYAPQSSDETILKTTYPIGNGRLGGKSSHVHLQLATSPNDKSSSQQCHLGRLVRRSYR